MKRWPIIRHVRYYFSALHQERHDCFMSFMYALETSNKAFAEYCRERGTEAKKKLDAIWRGEA